MAVTRTRKELERQDLQSAFKGSDTAILVGALERRLEVLEFQFFLSSGDSHRYPCAFCRSSMWPVSIATPGPIVEDTVTDFRNFPFAADGFALTTESTSAWVFSMRLCVAKEVLPSGAWMMPV